MNPEFCPNEIYIKDEATGEFIPMGNITYSELEPIKLEPVANEDIYGWECKKLSGTTFEFTMSLSASIYVWLIHLTNNWLRNHGYPASRKRRKKYEQ